MKFVGNLKSTQFIKLFIMFKSSPMQILHIFGPQQGSVFDFQSLNGFDN
jgi:hypothetical protein